MSREPRKFFTKHILRKIFLEDWAMKLVALVITFGLWFGVTVVSRGKQASERYTVPLNFRVLDTAMVTNAPVQEVELRVRGLDERIELIRRNDLVVNVDLTELKPGEQVLILTPETVSISLPDGVKLVDLQPSRIAVTIDTMIEKEVAVKAVVEGSPQNGFEVYGEPQILPQRVKVRGPKTLIENVDQLFTDKISLEDRNEDFFARQIPVTSADNKVTIYNTVVDVSVRIGEKRTERTISIPVSGQPGRTATATLYGPKTVLAKLKPADIQVEITKNNSGEDTPQFELPIELKDLIEIRKPKMN